MKHKRISICRYGYAIVPGDTNEKAIEYAANHLTEADFNWEPISAELIRQEAEVFEECEEDGSIVQVQNPE